MSKSPSSASVTSSASGSSKKTTKFPQMAGGASHARKMLDISDKEEPVEKNLLFRGFVGGGMFKTEMGYIGQKLDHLWARQIFESFPNDDIEIIDVAMKSNLADPEAIVEGGLYGAPFQIGGYGFHSTNQFEKQRDLLSDNERKASKGKEFLTKLEWEHVDNRLMEWATYGKNRIEKAVRGDTFATLAVRDSAFHVAKKLIEFGVDPLKCNEDGLDVFTLLKAQYEILTTTLSAINEEKAEGAQKVMLPSEVQNLQKRETKILNKLQAQVGFVNVFKKVMTVRVNAISGDRIKLQRLKITRKPIPPELAWNVEQADHAQSHVDNCDEFRNYIVSRIQSHEEYTKTHVNLGDLVKQQHARMEADSEGYDLEEDHTDVLAATIHQKKGLREARKHLETEGRSNAHEDEYDLVEIHSEDGNDAADASQTTGSSHLTELLSSLGGGPVKKAKKFGKREKHKMGNDGLPPVIGVLSVKENGDEVRYR